MAESMAAPRKSRSLLLIGLLIVLLAVTSSIAVYFFLDARDGNEAVASDVVDDEPVEAPVPIFVTVQPFTVNLQSDYGDRLLYVGLSLRVHDEATSTFLTQNMPEVRSRLLMLLSGKRAEELIKPEGKVKLKQQILDLFNEPITTPQPTLSIDDVLFSDFIVQ